MPSGRIQEVLNLPTETQRDDEIAATITRDAPDPGAPAIEFRDVHFRYPENVVAARQAAAKEAQTLLADAHLESAEDETTAAPEREVLRGRVVRSAARSSRGARGPQRCRQEHDPVAGRALLRPDRRLHPPLRPRCPHLPSR